MRQKILEEKQPVSQPSSEARQDTQALCNVIIAGLDDDLAQDIVAIDLADKAAFADYMVIASGRSQRHVGALAEHLLQRLKDAGQTNMRVEGARQGDWILVDAGDIVIHLFRPEIRQFYDLERMWGESMRGAHIKTTPHSHKQTTHNDQ